ncbi:BTAD domain-containing putative transcriptional regulator [Rhodococcus sp. NPDC003318]|uniref:BTAD domain-containing putative transcriptional regulator n=1 Tax=Rhodococcus sp. NPDC003318 TaxID=3364503 RepID=UPI0036954B89
MPTRGRPAGLPAPAWLDASRRDGVSTITTKIVYINGQGELFELQTGVQLSNESAGVGVEHHTLAWNTIGRGADARDTQCDGARTSAGLRFGVLGPLELWAGQQKLPLGGPQQRAIIGYLLIHANRVVATSQIVKALWPDGAPSTARKMLQNSVSSLRGVLSEHGGGSEIALLTHTPGYLLRTGTSNLDLLCFEELVHAGSTAIADGELETGARALREALDLWRGCPLEGLHPGARWPQLAALRQRRLTVFEDYVENELTLGRHRDHLAALERLVADDPKRERAARLLMLALYRCGRQADALAVYQRTRSVLMDTMGLEPTHELCELERAILEHDSGLHTMRAGLRSRVEHPDRRVGAARVIRGGQPERRSVNILTIAVDQPDRVPGDLRYAELVEFVSDACRMIGDAGGAIQYCTGSMVQAVFGASDCPGLNAAVRAAVDLDERFRRSGDVSVNVSVRTEEALLESREEGPVVYGPALEQALRTLRTLSPGEIWVCEETRMRGRLDVLDTTTRGRPAIRWSRLRRQGVNAVELPFLDRDNELVILDQYLEQSIGRNRGRTVTILGEAGIGKSRLVSEWVSRLDSRVAPPVILRSAFSRSRRTVALEEVSCLRGGHATVLEDGESSIEHLVADVQRQGPTVLVMEDLDLSDAMTRDLMGSLGRSAARLPLMTVATARSSTPDWSGYSMENFAALTLDRLSDSAVERMWTAVLGRDEGLGTLTNDMLRRIDGHPASALRSARSIVGNGVRSGAALGSSRRLA